MIVVSADITNDDPKWPNALVVPMSSSTSFKTRFCVLIPAGMGNSSKKSWARVTAVQPLAKTDIGDFMGNLPAQQLDVVFARMLEYVGLISEN